jgi:hypothetical protein
MDGRLAYRYPTKTLEKGPSYLRYYIISNSPSLQSVKKIAPHTLQKKLFDEKERDCEILSPPQQQMNPSKLTILVTASVYIFQCCHSFIRYSIDHFLNK